jgi:uncharacterized delta-60 repeat protein
LPERAALDSTRLLKKETNMFTACQQYNPALRSGITSVITIFRSLCRLAPRLRRCRNQVYGAIAIGCAGAAFSAFGAAGDLDPTFGNGGVLFSAIGTSHDRPFAVIVQPDSKILAAGATSDGTHSNFGLIRFNASGSPDTGFGAGGKVATAVGANSQANALTMQPDGKILVAGSSLTNGNSDFALLRYNANGELDTSFGAGGKVITPVGAVADAATVVKFLRDGRIIVGGFAGINGRYDFALARYHSDGSLDTSFGSGGKATAAIGSGDAFLYGLAFQADGKIVATGYAATGATTAFALARFSANGILDTSFGTGGKVTAGFGNSAELGGSVVIQPDGKIAVAGATKISGGVSQFALMRFTANGVLDAGFGTGGKVNRSIGHIGAMANDIALQPDGKLVVSGVVYDDLELAGIVRYNPNGTLDTTFGQAGIMITPLGPTFDYASAMALQADGKIVLARGMVTGDRTRFALIRVEGDEITGTVVEFYNTTLGHYFITASAAEQASIDAGGSGPGWTRTGESFKSGGFSRVCRFLGTPGVGPNSHFYTIDPAECAQVKADPGWRFESYDFSGTPPEASSHCRSGTIPVYRAYNNRFAANDSNHRYTTQIAIYSSMIAAGWTGENTVFCVTP